MQLDVSYILRKLVFLDSAISKLMEKHELEALYIRDKPTISNCKKQRRFHFAPELYKKGTSGEGGGGNDNGDASIG